MYTLNEVQLDWLTVTTFDPTASMNCLRFLRELETEPRDAKRMQYVGQVAHHRMGTAFAGYAEQMGKTHTMLQVSGMLAEVAWRYMLSDIAIARARVTRIDIQVTVPYDRAEWCQAAIFDVVRKARPDHSVSFAESHSAPDGGKLATVYFGSRTSDRLVRLYEKPGMGEDVYIRFETEYKGGLAAELGRKLALTPGAAKNVLAAEIFAFPHSGVVAHFDQHLHDPEPVRAVSEAGNTKRWLLRQVIPALDRFLNDHDATAHKDDVMEAFQKLLNAHN